MCLITFVVCLDVKQLPDFIHFEDDGYVYTETAHEPGQGYLLVKIGAWTEHYPDEGTHMQYAKVLLSDKENEDYFAGLLF